jgi:hypothetical protein
MMSAIGVLFPVNYHYYVDGMPGCLFLDSSEDADLVEEIIINSRVMSRQEPWRVVSSHFDEWQSSWGTFAEPFLEKPGE